MNFGVGDINIVKLRRARLVLGLVTFGGSTIPLIPVSGPLSLAIRPWVGARSTSEEFCVAVGAAARTAGMLAYFMLA